MHIAMEMARETLPGTDFDFIFCAEKEEQINWNATTKLSIYLVTQTVMVQDTHFYGFINLPLFLKFQ